MRRELSSKQYRAVKSKKLIRVNKHRQRQLPPLRRYLVEEQRPFSHRQPLRRHRISLDVNDLAAIQDEEQQEYINDSEEAADEGDEDDDYELQPYMALDDSVEADDNGADDYEDDDPVDKMPITSVLVLRPKLILAMMKSFDAAGYVAWFSSIAGGKRAATDISTMLRTTVKLLLRINSVAISKGIVSHNKTSLEFFADIIMNHALYTVVNDVIRDYPLRPSSLNSHLCHMIVSLRWIQFQPTNLHKANFSAQCLRLEDFLRTAAKGTHRAIAKEKKMKDNTVVSAIENNRYPPGGLPQLQAQVNKDFELLVSLFDNNQTPTISSEFYIRFFQLLQAAQYTHSPAGRNGGIESLTLDHIREFENDGFALNCHFKNAATLKYQPVILNHITKRLLNIYLTKLRPVVCKKNTVLRKTDPLFLNFNGEPFTHMDRLNAAYWERTLGMWLTTTTMRQIQETEVENRLGAGEITVQQRAAIAKVCGHSLGTARDTYVRTDLAADTRHATDAFRVLASAPLEDADVQNDDALPVLDIAVKWGRLHPCINSPIGTNVKWTLEERNYLSAVAATFNPTAHHQGFGGSSGGIMSYCLKAIRAEPTCWDIFHPRYELLLLIIHVLYDSPQQ